jgi:hypothetical protein
MQQEWPSHSIMTSRRQVPTGGLVGSFLLVLMLAACAALPEDSSVMEQLDEDTGLTIARLGRPMELYRETFQRDPAGRFAYLGPFETNRMGARDSYLWIALPVDLAADTTPDLELDGHGLALGPPMREASDVGLHKSPYKIPTPWSAMFYYKADEALIARLGAATTLTVRVTEQTKDGTAITVFASTIADTRLKDFAAR